MQSVEYVKLKNLAEIGTGSSDRKDASENGAYPFYVRSRDVLKKDSYEYDETAILIPGEGGIGDIFHYISGKYALHQRVYRIHLTSDALDTKFLYYYMFAHFKAFIMSKAVSSTVSSIRKPMIEEFAVPIIPIERQKEIVETLDAYTEDWGTFSEKLQSEICDRTKQYNYFKDRILSSSTNNQPYKMGDLFDFRNGLSKGKEFFGRGIPFIRFTDVYNKRSLRKEDITALVECTEKEKQTLKVSRGDVLFTRTSETAEDVGWASVVLDELDECVFNGFTIRATPKTGLLLPEYCEYCFTTNEFRKYASSHCSFTTRASLTGNTIAEFMLSIPSLDEQKRIVSELKELETAYTGLNALISEELVMRKKQFEYYRSELLSFDKD